MKNRSIATKHATYIIIFLFFSVFCFSAVSANANMKSNFSRFSEKFGYTTESNVNPGVIVAQIIKLALSVLGVIFVILTIHAGYLWMTANGDSEQVDAAKNKIKTAVIGLIIIIMAYTITYFVLEKLVEDIVTR